MGVCSSKCMSEGSTVDTVMGKCQNMPCKCALSCFNSVKDDMPINDKVKEFIENTIQQYIKGIDKTTPDDNSNNLP